MESRRSITIQTAALGITRYSERQLDLYRKIYRLRHVERLTFQAIAARLNDNGVQSTTGKPFSAELVFGLNKKRTGCAKQPVRVGVGMIGLWLQTVSPFQLRRILLIANSAIKLAIKNMPHSDNVGTDCSSELPLKIEISPGPATSMAKVVLTVPFQVAFGE